MSAIARVLLERGYKISGSDLRSTEITRNLEQAGAIIFEGHRQEYLDGANLVVYSTAIPRDNPELIEAQKRNLPLKHRADLLAEILNQSTGITIAGAHGKTTTTSMLGLALSDIGVDPTVLIGALSDDLCGNARPGNSPYVIAEACESDYSFLKYSPYAAVVTNIDPDHLENYQGDFNKLIEAYRSFLLKVKKEGFSLICSDDPILNKLKEEPVSRVLTYGFSKESDYQPGYLEYQNRESRFELLFRGKSLGKVHLAVPGEHNVLNAVAALAVGHQLGFPVNELTRSLAKFHGARRRFQIIGYSNEIMVVDDYAHHPTEISKTLQAAKLQNMNRVVAFFQPKRYTRTKYLFNEFTRAFNEADLLVMSEIFPFGEKPIPGITSEVLSQEIEKETGKTVKLLPYNHSIIVNYLLGILQPGDLAMIMGAGDDIAELAQKVYSGIQEKHPSRAP